MADESQGSVRRNLFEDGETGAVPWFGEDSNASFLGGDRVQYQAPGGDRIAAIVCGGVSPRRTKSARGRQNPLKRADNQGPQGPSDSPTPFFVVDFSILDYFATVP